MAYFDENLPRRKDWNRNTERQKVRELVRKGEPCSMNYRELRVYAQLMECDKKRRAKEKRKRAADEKLLGKHATGDAVKDSDSADLLRDLKSENAALRRKIKELQEENRTLKFTRFDGQELRKARMMNKQHRRVNMHHLVDEDAELLFKALCKAERLEVKRKNLDEAEKLRKEQESWKKNKPEYTKEETKGE